MKGFDLAGIAPVDQVFVQRRDINQGTGVTDGIVLMLVVHFVGADRVIARPLAVVKTLA